MHGVRAQHRNNIFDSIEGFIDVLNYSSANINIFSYIDGRLCDDAVIIFSKVVDCMNKQKVKNNVENTLLEKQY